MSFQATEWARSLPLHSISAKFTLMMIGSYAGTDGACFPSLNRLAEDTLQSVQTVRRRIRELEQLGLLVRLTRWTSSDGGVVLVQPAIADRPAGCRQSSDELRLLLQVKPEELAAKIATLGDMKESPDQGDGDGAGDSGEGIKLEPSPPDSQTIPSPSQAADSPGVSPGSNPLKRLLETSLESPPCPPASTGGNSMDEGLRKEGEDRFAIVEPLWPGPITNAERSIVILGALTAQEWADCQIGIKGYRASILTLRDNGKDPEIRDFRNWARNRQWAGYLTKGREAEALGQRIAVDADSVEGRAWHAVHAVGRIEPKEFGGKYLLPGPLSPQVLAFASAPPNAEWVFVPEAQRQQTGAWNSFLRKVLAGKALPELVTDRTWRGAERIAARGFLAPWAWPPRVDGTLTTGPPDDSEVS